MQKLFNDEKFKIGMPTELYSYFDNNTDNIRTGMAGEQLLRKYLFKKGFAQHQIDCTFEIDNKLYFAEVKTVEMYNNPDSHGLSKAQYDRRMTIYNKYDIETVLFIVCQTTYKVYVQSLVELSKAKNKFLSKTGSFILFPIDNYIAYEIKDLI